MLTIYTKYFTPSIFSKFSNLSLFGLFLGNAALVGLPGEPFSEGGLAIKLESPSPYTIIAHNTQFAGYIPTKEAFLRGGYETITSNWSKFGPDALDQIVTASLDTLKAVLRIHKIDLLRLRLSLADA